MVSVGPHKTYLQPDEFLDLGLDIVVECAGSAAVHQYAEMILEQGIDIIIISVGSLIEELFLNGLTEVAQKTGSKIIIPSGALAGLDAISAAALDGLKSVFLTSRKKPLAWTGAPGVIGIDLTELQSELVLFSGSAREAAKLFPKNANVAAAVGFAGIGLDRTKVELIADPSITQNIHCLEVNGSFGELSIQVNAEPSSSNPKTSLLAALSINRQLDKISASFII
jgi:aspartate dehydrogenase